MLLEDEVELENTYTRYNSLDPNIEGSPEGDFMQEALAAYKAHNGDQYLEAVAKL